MASFTEKNTSNNEEEDDEFSVEELRALAENLNFNLTSVLQNPRGNTSKSFYEEMRDFDPFRFTFDNPFKDDFENELDPGKLPPPPVPLPVVTMDMFDNYIDRNGSLLDKFSRNHPSKTTEIENGSSGGAAEASQAENGIEIASEGESSETTKLSRGAFEGGSVPTPRQVYAEVPALFQKAHFTLAEPAVFEQVVLLAPEDRHAQLTHYLDLVEVSLLKQISSRQDSFFEALSNLQALRSDVSVACQSVATLRAGIVDLQSNMVSGVMKVPQLARRKQNLNSLQRQLNLVAKLQGKFEQVQTFFEAADFLNALSYIKEAQHMVNVDLQGVKCIKNIAKQLGEYETSAAKFLGTQFINCALDESGRVEFEEADNELQNHDDDNDDELMNAGKDVLGGESETVLARDERLRLVRLVRALVRIGEMSATVEKHHRRLEDTVKLIVRVTVEEYVFENSSDPITSTSGATTLETNAVNAATGAKTASLSDAKLGVRLSNMSCEAFVSCLNATFDSILSAMKRAAAVHAVVEHTLNETTHNQTVTPFASTRLSPTEENESALKEGEEDMPPASPPSLTSNHTSSISTYQRKKTLCEEALKSTDFMKGTPTYTELIAESIKGLRDVCDLAQKSISALLVNRKEVHMKLELHELLSVTSLAFDFVNSLEKLSGRSCFALRSCLLAQQKSFLEHLQEKNLNNLAASLDCEKWTQSDITPERQASLDRLAAGQAGVLLTQNGNHSASSIPSVVKSKKSKHASEALFNNNRFKVVWSCLLLVEMVSGLLNTCAAFPMLASDVHSRVVELLRLFNQRSTQLVLLAGAIHSSARLSKITAKHLALTSQCLGLVLALHPHIRAALASHLPPKQHVLLSDLDTVKQDYVEHHERILSKFVSIVAEIVHSLSKSVTAADWDRPTSAAASHNEGQAVTGETPQKSNGSCPFVADVIKNTTTMHKVLSAQLPPEQVQEIFTRIFELLNRKIPEYFVSIKPSTPAGEQRVLDDIQYLGHSLERLRGVNANVLNLEPVFRERFPNAR